jgi:hypothetical protein
MRDISAGDSEFNALPFSFLQEMLQRDFGVLSLDLRALGRYSEAEQFLYLSGEGYWSQLTF